MAGKTEQAGIRSNRCSGNRIFSATMLFVVILLLSVTTVSAMHSGPHFVVPDSETGSSMTVIVPSAINPTLDGIAIQTGDEIGVFDSTGLCVGAKVWTTGANAGIAVWGQTTAGSRTLPGMIHGEVLQFRLWSNSSATEMHAAATYISGTSVDTATADSTYVENGISILGSLTGYSLPGAPTLSAPGNGASNQPTALNLSWTFGKRRCPRLLWDNGFNIFKFFDNGFQPGGYHLWCSVGFRALE